MLTAPKPSIMPSRTRIARIWRTLTRLEPAKPALKLGLRAGVAAVVPVIAARLLHAPWLAQITLGGFLAALADKGGAYRTRAATMSAFGVAAALSVSLGALAARDPRLAVGFAFVGVFAAAFARVFGDLAGSVGNLVAIVLAVALAAPARGVAEALARGAAVLGLCLGDGARALALAAAALPARARGRRRVLSGARRVCGLRGQGSPAAPRSPRSPSPSHARAPPRLARGPPAPPPRRSGAGARARPGAASACWSSSRAQISLRRADRADRSARRRRPGRRVPARPRRGRPRARGVRGGGAHDCDCHRDGGARARGAGRRVGRARGARGRPARPGARRAAIPDGAARAQILHAAELLGRLAEFARVAAETAVTLDDDSPVEDAEASPPPSLRGEAPSRIARLVGPIRDNLTARSLTLRHALRVGIAAAVAVAFGASLHLPRGYWITVTAVFILQPYAGATFQRGLQRMVGTVLGGLLAAGITAVVHDPSALLAVIFALAVAGVSLLPVNYGAFSALLTPTFVLLAEMSSATSRSSTCASRAPSSAARSRSRAAPCSGRARSASASPSRWPRRSARRARCSIARRSQAPRPKRRRGLPPRAAAPGSAMTNAEASFQRLVVESRGPAEALDAHHAAHVRAPLRLVRRRARIIPRCRGRASRAEAARFAERVRVAIGEIAAAVAARRAPSPLPDLLARGSLAAASGAPESSGPMTFRALRLAQIERVARQVEVLHAAATRLDPRALAR